MSENLRAFTKAVYGMDHVVRGVADDAWDRSTPCAEWTAAELLLHACGTVRMVHAIAAGAEVEAAAGGPRSVWEATREGALEALDQAGALQKVGATPFGEMSVDQLIGVMMVDVLTHTWDLARGTGGDDHLPADLVGRAHATLLPMSAMLRGPGRFDDEFPADASDDAQTRFIKFLGRQP